MRHKRTFGQNNGTTRLRDDADATEKTRTQAPALIGQRRTHTDGATGNINHRINRGDDTLEGFTRQSIQDNIDDLPLIDLGQKNL